MNLSLSRKLFLVATGFAASVMAQPSTAPGAGVATDDERGLLGDIPGFAAAAASAPASAASAGRAMPRRTDPGSAAPRQPAAAPVKPATNRPKEQANASSRMPAGLGVDTRGSTDTERVVFQLAPVRVVLPIDRERTVSLPGQFALHAPEGFDTLVRSQIIERTAYLKALAPFGSLRVVAEDLTTGRQIPLDLVSVPGGGDSPRPMEVFVPTPGADRGGDDKDPGRSAREAAPLDMVALTRYAAQALYAPRRLIPSSPAVRQVPVPPAPVEGLYRGWRIETVPIGAWRSGDLYVTAVRFTNTGEQPIDLDLQELRGRWLAATAQHMRLLASDPAWRTTTVYLVCDRPFDACR